MPSKVLYQRAYALFLELCDLPAEQQARRLDEITAEDAELGAAVAGMLAQDPGASAAPAETQARPAPTAVLAQYQVQPGDQIGRYRLDEQLGIGGMGVVFAATQLEPIRRPVALKIIKPGTDTREIMQRFEAERQALALMDHPHIARVLDAGQTETGLPYFVMELVRGVPITEYCDQHKLNSEQRLRLFIDVCDAVQHAHQKGIIHRDIKPHNILVTTQEDQPVAKVIDFGVAKALHRDLIDDQAYTAISQLVGTPLYMSPEQADLNAVDIDTRSDIYSLGVLLYELLTGVTPIEGARLKQAAFDEVRRIIREEEPQKPSTRISSLGDTATDISELRQSDPADLAKQLSGDLDLIVMKALEKDRTRRYETANGFAADVERYLNHEPVLASPPSNLYKFRKFVRRNRTGVLAASLVALALVLGVVGTSFGMVSAWRQKQLADQEKVAAQKEASRREAISDFLIMDLLWQAAPEANEYADQVTVLELLDRSAERITQSDPFAENPEAEIDVRLAIGNTYYSLGNLAGAREHLERAYSLSRATHGLEHNATLFGLNLLVQVLAAQGHLDESEQLLRLELATTRKVNGPNHRFALITQNNLAELLRRQGKDEASEQLHRQTLATRKKQLGDDDSDVFESLHNLGSLLSGMRRPGEAEPLLREALEGRSTHPDLGPEHVLTNTTRHGLGYCCVLQGKHAEAMELYTHALETSKRVEGPTHPNVYTTMNNLSDTYLILERYEEGLEMALQSLAGRRKILDPSHTSIASSAHNVGSAYSYLKRDEEALPFFKESYEIYLDVVGADYREALNTACHYARCLNRLQRHDEAIAFLQEAIRAARTGNPTPKLSCLLREIEAAHMSLGNPEQAEFWRNQLPEEDRELPPTQNASEENSSEQPTEAAPK